MLLLFIFLNVFVLTIANPYHKYPYTFLLDVGNEEIEKADIEQIRLSVPGGSMAIKYPAIGDGDLIGQVRVSGIDFGTDLKANIAEGGPGYKYVVVVFYGKPGKTYDAVVTIQTLPVNGDEINIDEGGNVDENNNVPLNSDDDDDSADDNSNANSIEDKDRAGSMTVYSSEDSEVMQSSSNIYKYAINEELDSKKYGDDESSNNDGQYEGEVGNEQNVYSESKSQSDDGYVKDDSSESLSQSNKISEKYAAFKPHFYGGVRFYPQAAVYTQGVYDQSDDDADIPVNENDGNQSDKYKESKNNADADYALPIDY